VIQEYCRFRDGFEELLDERFYYIEWLDKQFISGAYKLFSCADAAALVEIKTYPTGAREVHGVAATGNLKSILSDLIPRIEAYGRDQGCEIAGIESRAAWVRLMKPHGYEQYQTCIRKDL
jgi:hypothetical protein